MAKQNLIYELNVTDGLHLDTILETQMAWKSWINFAAASI
ncbi:hypothetical protein M3J09_005420 [Ascochyta lentis]